MLFGDAIPGAQNSWRWCHKCEGLFFARQPSGAGRCPAGGAHDTGGSGHYSLLFGDQVAGTQGDWRWCEKCEGLFFAGNSTTGHCPAGSGHDGNVSGAYGVPWETPSVASLDFDTGVISFSGGVPVGGSAHVTLRQDGSYHFVGHFHKSSIFQFDYSVVLTVLDVDNRVYAFAHQYSFGGGVADDDFGYQGNNAAIATNWLALVPGASSRWQANAGLDLGALLNTIVQAIQDVAEVISVVSG
jgi:hypothetical protein